MNKYGSLTKLQLKDFISRYQSGLNLKRGNLGSILLVIVAALLFYPSFILSQTLYEPLALMGNPHIIITLGYIAASMIMLVTAAPFILSIFFYSKDTTFLSSLPLKESTIVFSKLTAMYIYLLAISAFILGPVMGVYLYNSHQFLLNLIPAFIVFIISPIIPIALATIIILPLMRFAGSRKRRNLYTVIGNLVLLLIILSMQLFLTRVQTNPEALEQLLMQSDGLLNIVGKAYLPSIWITNMMKGSYVDALLFFISNALILLVLFVLSKLIYRKAVQAFNQQGSSSIKQGEIYYKKRSIGFQLIRRHILIIITNPTFFLNTFMVMIVPIIIFISILFTGEASFEMLKSPLLDPIKLYIFAGAATSPAIMGSIAATAITREGKTFWETKVLPISIKDNIRYRIINAILISLVGTVLLSIVSIFIMRISFLDFTLGMLAAISATIFLMHIDFIVNIYRPMLGWMNPTAAVKNNLNVMISLAIRVVVAGLLYLIYIVLKGLEPRIMILVFTVIFILLSIIIRHILYSRYQKRFHSISG